MALIHILDKQTDEIIGTLNIGDYYDDFKISSLDSQNTFDFIALKHFDKLQKRNRLLLKNRDGFFDEYIIEHVDQFSRKEKQVNSNASFIDLRKAKIIEPQTLEGATADTATDLALLGTEWKKGRIDFNGIRTIRIEDYTNPYSFLKRIASTFGLQLRFRIEVVDGNKIERYVDLLLPDDDFDGKEAEFGKDLLEVRRIEDAQNIVTALLVLGPQQEDGTRMSVLVEDTEALQRWSRNGQHLIEVYEPQITSENVTVQRLRILGENELKKRVDAIVKYACQAAIIDHIHGKEHEKVSLGDTIRIKDTGYLPPLYLEAKVLQTKEQPSTNKLLDFTLGNYIEYSEEDLKAQISALRKQLNERLSKLVQVTVTSSAGTVFKNGEGETTLTATTFLNGQEVDEEGTQYEYIWTKYDKNGNLVGATTGKSITVYANNIDEKETYIVTIENEGAKSIGQITVTNVKDGRDGEPGPKGDKGDPGPQGVQGPPGKDGQTMYTWIKYADDENGNGMSDYPTGKEYIGLAYNKETPNESNNPSDYTWAKIKGEQGVQGPKGADGQTTYTWVKYADDDKGSGMSDSPDGKLYIGLAFNKTTPEESNNPPDYTWSLMPQNIEIGGRNLLKNTSDEWTTLQLSDSQYYFQQGTDTRLEVGVTYTFSILVEKVSDDDVPIRVNIGTGTKGNFQRDKGSKIPVEFGKRFTLTFTITENDIANGYEYFAWRLRNEKQVTTIRFKEVKLEKGNKATDWTPAPEDIEAEIEKAKQDAKNAQNTADGKNTVFYQTSTPSTTGRKIGDIWFNTGDGYKMHRFDGSNWVAAQFGTNAIASLSITNALIANGAIDNAKIANLDAGKITTGYLSANRIATRSIDVSKLNVTELSAITANLGTVTAGTIKGVNIIGSTLTATGSNNASVTIDSNGWYVKDESGNVKICVTTKETDFAVRQPSAIQFFDLSGNQAGYVGMYEDQDIMGLYSDTKLIITAPEIEIGGYSVTFNGDNGRFRIRANGIQSAVWWDDNEVCGWSYWSSAWWRFNWGTKSFEATNYAGNSFLPITASGWNTSSKAEYKTDIKKWEESALDLINNTTIYQYRLKDDIENGIDNIKQGIVIGDGYRTPEKLVDDGSSIDQYRMNSWSWKAIQELYQKIKELEEKMA